MRRQVDVVWMAEMEHALMRRNVATFGRIFTKLAASDDFQTHQMLCSEPDAI
jgi:hypothetical protein